MKSLSPHLDDLGWPHWAEVLILGTPVKAYIVAAITFAVVYIFLSWLLRTAHRLAPTLVGPQTLSHIIRVSLENVRPWTLIAISLYMSLQGFSLPLRLNFFINLACIFLVTVQVLLIANIWIRFVFRESALVKGSHSQIRTMSGSLTSVAIIICWTLAMLVLFDNFGFDVKTVAAGLGVGGLALGLALQSVLGDIIASFTIGFDGPFEVGDFIIVDGLMGTVERVGLKTTRIRSLGGELLIFPNAKLVNSNILNYKRMQQRRVVFNIGVAYDTDQESLEEIPRILKNAVESTHSTRLDRAHFASYSDSALRFEIVYYVLVADFNVYMDVQQEINFKIRREFQKLHINFAFPTRTLDLPVELREALLKMTEPAEAQEEAQEEA